jgi:dephospho-CoA kinase
MKRILVTGMSGTGKSSVIGALAARGYKAIDADSDAWSEWAPYVAIPDLPEQGEPALEWVWRADRIRDLLMTEDAALLFVGGCASNMGQFYGQFDHVVLLSAPTPVIVRRLAARTNNTYGQRPEELARILGHIETVEPLLRRRATREIDTAMPLEDVVAALLALAEERP